MVAISTRKIVLHDHWPGHPNQNLGKPTGGFDSTTYTDSSTEAYPVGTKIQPYQDFSGLKGPYTMIYLRYYCLSESADVGVSTCDNSLTGQAIFAQFCNSTCLSADGTAALFSCTNRCTVDTGQCCATNSGIMAIACGTLSYRDVTTEGGNPGGYGWFWCGGPCPMDITFLSGIDHAGVDMSTGGGVADGEPITLESDTSVWVLDGGDLSSVHVGEAFATDA